MICVHIFQQPPVDMQKFKFTEYKHSKSFLFTFGLAKPFCLIANFPEQ